MPLLLATSLPGLMVVMGVDRYRAGLLAMERLAPDVFILDDGYQHLAIERDADLLLLDSRDPFGGGLPPRGRLREPLSALARADAFIFTRVERGEPTAEALATLERWNPSAPVFTARSRAAGLQDDKGALLEGSALSDRRFVAVCGIAQPGAFASTIASIGLRPEETLAFRDHHRYTARDFARIHRVSERTGASWVLTTEKDAVKLSGRLSLPLVTVRLAVEIVEPGFFPFLASAIAATPRAAVPAGR